MENITSQLENLFNDALKTGDRIKAGVEARKLIRSKMTELQKSVARSPKDQTPAA